MGPIDWQVISIDLDYGLGPVWHQAIARTMITKSTGEYMRSQAWDKYWVSYVYLCTWFSLNAFYTRTCRHCWLNWNSAQWYKAMWIFYDSLSQVTYFLSHNICFRLIVLIDMSLPTSVMGTLWKGQPCKLLPQIDTRGIYHRVLSGKTSSEQIESENNVYCSCCNLCAPKDLNQQWKAIRSWNTFWINQYRGEVDSIAYSNLVRLTKRLFIGLCAN